MLIRRVNIARLLRVTTLGIVLATFSGLSGCGNGLFSSLTETPGQLARDAFNPDNPDKRRQSINKISAASWGGETPYLKAYRQLATDPDPTVRSAATRALAQHGVPEDVPLLARLLHDPIAPVRWEAAEALCRIHAPLAQDELLRVLREDEIAAVRQVCARALAQYANPAVFQGLVGALNDSEYVVVNQSTDSLTQLTGQMLGEDGAAWLEWARGRQDIFANRKPYRYVVYRRPQGWLDYLQPWVDTGPPKPLQPRGIDASVPAPVPSGALSVVTTVSRRSWRGDASDSDGLYLYARRDETGALQQVILADAPPGRVESGPNYDDLIFYMPNGTAHHIGARPGLVMLKVRPETSGSMFIMRGLPEGSDPVEAFHAARQSRPDLTLRDFLLEQPAYGGPPPIHPMLNRPEQN